MSEYIYTKSITSDFSDNFNSDNLKGEIDTQGFTPNLLRVDRLGDTITMIFDAELSAGEQTTLNDTLVPGHSSNVPIVYTNTINNVLRNNEIKDTTYKRACTFIYEGSDFINPIIKIVGIGHMDSGVTSYSIVVEDHTNNIILAENTFTNTVEELIELTPISNIPTEKSKIEVSVKKTGGSKNKKAYVESITFYLG